MTLADAVVNEALEYDGAIDDEKDTGRPTRHNWEALQTFFTVVPGWVWTPARIRQAKTPWKFITENGADNGHKVHWCGIFATWAMHQAGCPVHWRGDKGIFWENKLMSFLDL